MRRLASSALALLLLAPACGDDTQDGPDRGAPAPIGSIRVSWSLKLTTGAPITCSALNLSGVRIRVAGLEAVGAALRDGGTAPDTTVDCETGEQLYTGVTVGRYPVRVSLMRGASTVQEIPMNVDVMEGETTEAAFAFEFEPSVAEDRGNLKLRWTIDRRPAAITCAEFEGATIEIRTEAASIEQVSREAACTAGELQLESLRAGSYRFRLRLLKASGESVATGFVDATVVAAVDTNANVVNLAPANPLRAAVVALWTVNSSTDTATACSAVNATEMMLIMSAVSGQGSPDPITTSCAAGRLGHDNLLDDGLFDLQLRFVYDGGLTVTSTTFTNVRIERSQTTTVSANFITD